MSAILPTLAVTIAPAAVEAVLVDALARADFVGVHAAEFLIALGKSGPVLAAYRPRAVITEPKLRIGTWRVLARCEPDAAARAAYVAKCRAALLDANGPDRLHALETLAKLNVPIDGPAEHAAVEALAADAPLAPFARWRLVQANVAGAGQALIDDLTHADAVCRARAAFALSKLPTIDSAAALRDALAKEPKESLAFPAISAAVGGDAARALLAAERPGPRYTGVSALAERGELATSDRPRLKELLADADADVRVAAAFALLTLGAPAKQ